MPSSRLKTSSISAADFACRPRHQTKLLAVIACLAADEKNRVGLVRRRQIMMTLQAVGKGGTSCGRRRPRAAKSANHRRRRYNAHPLVYIRENRYALGIVAR